MRRHAGSRQNDARVNVATLNCATDDGMADLNRIQKELREIASDAASGVTVTQHGDSLTHMKGTITGACVRACVSEEDIGLDDAKLATLAYYRRTRATRKDDDEGCERERLTAIGTAR